MTSYIIFAFVSGFLLATLIFWITTKQLQKDWHAEYRRLMGGIDLVGFNILKKIESQNSTNQNYLVLERTQVLLKQLYDGDDISWKDH